MYYDDHAPPHFHAIYSGEEALIDIKNASILTGKLSPRVLGLVVEWTILHQDELLENWNLGEKMKSFKKIEPLK